MRTVTAVPTRRSLASANGSLIMISSAASGAGARPSTSTGRTRSGGWSRPAPSEMNRSAGPLDARDPAVGHPRVAHVGQRRHGGDEPGLVGGHLHPDVVEVDRVGEAGVGRPAVRAPQRRRAQHQAGDQPEQHAEQQEARSRCGARSAATARTAAHATPRPGTVAHRPPAPGRHRVRVADRHPAADPVPAPGDGLDPHRAADRADPVGHVLEPAPRRRRRVVAGPVVRDLKHERAAGRRRAAP